MTFEVKRKKEGSVYRPPTYLLNGEDVTESIVEWRGEGSKLTITLFCDFHSTIEEVEREKTITELMLENFNNLLCKFVNSIRLRCKRNSRSDD